jgi:2'-5' RNA ligase
MPRLFVAVDLPAGHAAAFQQLGHPDLQARWLPPEQYHVTLRFLGDVDEDRSQKLRVELESIDLPSFQMGGEGLDVFPSRRKPRVLVAHVNEEPGLMTLQQQINDLVTGMGFDEQRNPFNPHVTIARLQKATPREVRTYLNQHPEFKIEAFSAERFRLYESELGADGAVHNVLHEYLLRSSSSAE